MSKPVTTATRPITVEEAIRGRRSTRAFLKDQVPRELVARILETANRAPSGSNIQPWKVWVVDGEVKQQISKEMLETFFTAGEG
ncbi:MAG TPA: nitroreductase family protein, partial [Hyphomicrobiaceae bacterium]|nr:nitroreductase family protein [Hyphomicrobiaceae bacterium]